SRSRAWWRRRWRRGPPPSRSRAPASTPSWSDCSFWRWPTWPSSRPRRRSLRPRNRRLDGYYSRGVEAAALDDEGGDLVHPLGVTQVGEDERARAAHAPRVTVHHVERGAHMRREVGLVDHEEIRAGDAGPALGRDLVACR